MRFLLPHMVIAEDKRLNIEWVVRFAVALELLLYNLSQLILEVKPCTWTHNPVTERPHALIAEDVCHCVFFPFHVLLVCLRIDIEYIFFLCIKGHGHYIRAELRDVLELSNLRQT